MNDGNPYPPAVVARLTQLWKEGDSASVIAKKLAAENLGAFTRNAIIGKVHRLGLAGRATPSRPAKRMVRVRPQITVARRTRKMLAPPSQPMPAIMENLPPLVDDAGAPVAASVLALGPCQCRYPIGDPRGAGFGFCARQVAPDEHNGGVPYCAVHQRLTRVAGSGAKAKRGRGRDAA
jgi:GcrA cell cycle regulator